jgi:hypothetical protein
VRLCPSFLHAHSKGGSCREGLKNPPPPPKSKAAPKARAEPEKTKASTKDGFSRVIQPTSGRSVLNVLDTLLPETRKNTVLTASHPGTSGVSSSLSRVFKSPGRGKITEVKFSDDNIKQPTVTRGPSTLKIIDSIRSPSPDFGSDDMDDLIRAAPSSALDADNFTVAVDLTIDDAEDISSPSDVPRASRKRLRDPLPPPDRSFKRMRRVSDWEGDFHQHRFGPVRPESVQEVGSSPTVIALGWDLDLGFNTGY